MYSRRMDICWPRITAPGIVKNIALETTQNMNTHVCCSKNTCTKKFYSNAIYEKELSIYDKKLDYVPNMMSHNDKNMTITTERIDKSLGSFFDSGFIFHKNKNRHKYDERIKDLNSRFLKDTGLHHNDILYKNTLKSKDDKLYLIDFELADIKYRENNFDKILN